MNNLTQGENFLKRSIKRPEGKPTDALIMLLAIILMVLLSIFVNVYPQKRVAHAAERIDYKDVHTKKAACSYFELYPEKISNVKEYKANCL